MNRHGHRLCAWIIACCTILTCEGTAAEPVKVQIGSKKFTESVILGEMLTHLATDAGADAIHRRQLGGTRVLWNALRMGEIDVYPEYTGTLLREILVERGIDNELALTSVLTQEGLRMSRPLGFNNTYALGMRPEVADSLGIKRISDLRDHPDLRLGFTNEFLDRGDGWPGLRDHYGLPYQRVVGLDHDLAYRGLAAGSLDVTDFYSTDAEIAYYGFRVLEDDLRYFPDYRAVILYRADLAERAPAVVRNLLQLENAIDADTMTGLNARVKLDGKSDSETAASFLASIIGVVIRAERESFIERLLRHTGEHLALVGISLAAAVLIAIPLGVVSARHTGIGQVVLSVTGILQTVPALALLVFMIPLFGIGGPPAVVALFLYSLLPIVRNTHAGLTGIPTELREVAVALNLPPWFRLRRIELPLASRSILAGIKIAAVINVGTATLGALIGAGGYGQPILTGIRLDDVGLILEGAVPAALLALAIQGLFEIIDRLVVPRGLRLTAES
ncbi:MAG: ABC transporter permease subunit [Candidatus Latescibacterota bacterium]|nr:MAG: ABC transporter permease subunit [Candidatus Latescibacterota bacterium]